MRQIKETKVFRRVRKRGKDLDKLFTIVERLANGEALPPSNRDHALGGNWKDHRECHIEPDWLLIYLPEGGDLILTRTGSHSDLFR